MYVRKMMKKTAVPIRLCFVETGSSFGTGIKEKISTALRTLIGRGALYYWMKESLSRDLRLALFGPSYSLMWVEKLIVYLSTG